MTDDDTGRPARAADAPAWLWSRLDDWISGRPGEATIGWLAAAAPGSIPRDVVVFLGPSLIRTSDTALRSHAVQTVSGEVVLERAQREASLELTERWGRAGIPHAFFKGTDVRHRLYPDPHRRSSNDVDVLCAPRHRSAALDVLTAAGFRPSEPVGDFVDGATHEVSVRRGDVVVDLHVSLVQPSRARFDADTVLAGVEPLTVEGGALPVPERHAAVALVLVHIGRHEAGAEYVGMKHGLDVALACDRWSDLDWDRVAGHARDWRCFRLAAVGLWCWVPAFADRLPRPALAALDPGPFVRYLARRSRTVLAGDRRRASGLARVAQLGLKFAFAEGLAERRWLVGELVRRMRGVAPDRPADGS